MRLLDEPPPSRSDIHFVLFGFPVRIHPLFWLMALVLGYNSGAQEVAAWVVAVLIAILVHEWGHALAMRSYGLRPSITLHGLGGVTSARDGQGFGPPLRMWEHVLILGGGTGGGLPAGGGRLRRRLPQRPRAPLRSSGCPAASWWGRQK